MAGSQYMYELAGGNPGALSVVGRLDVIHLEKLKGTDLRGSMIWVGYKDICGEDINEFREKILNGTIEGLVHETPHYKYEKAEGRI